MHLLSLAAKFLHYSTVREFDRDLVSLGARTPISEALIFCYFLKREISKSHVSRLLALDLRSF